MLHPTTDISFLDESIQPFIKKFGCYEHYGAIKREIHIEEVPVSDDEASNDHFVITIPYANKSLKFNVFFNLDYPELGPDFIFEDDFLSDPEIEDIKNFIPSLANWDVNNEQALIDVVSELIDYYKLYQLSIAEQFGERVKVECSMLDTDILQEDVELIVENTSKPEVWIYINLNIDFSGLPYRTKCNFRDMAYLAVSVQDMDWNHVVPHLELTEELNETLQRLGNIKLPPWKGHECLNDYIKTVKSILEKTTKNVTTAYKRRLMFMAYLKQYAEENLIEYDIQDFSYFCMMFEHQDYFIIVKFTLPDMFPNEKPEITLYSIYDEENLPEKTSYPVQNFEYDPTWPPEEMIPNLMNHIIEKELDKFVQIISLSMELAMYKEKEEENK